MIPWRGGCSHRARALYWVQEQYERLGWPVVVCAVPEDQPWVKAKAVMPAIRRAKKADVIVVSDADVWSRGIEQALKAVEGGAPWAMPHRGVYRLTLDSTEAVMRGAVNWEALATEREWYLGTEGGGCVVADRETFLEVPLDPRFIGWGQEDESWGIAMRCLLGPVKRIKQPLLHLWHPPQDRLTLRKGNMISWGLHQRYLRAQYDPQAMRNLLAEIQ